MSFAAFRLISRDLRRARQRRFRDLPENAALILGYLRAWDNAKVEPCHQYPALVSTEANGSVGLRDMIYTKYII